jgi:hypothetical protein
MGLFRLIFGGGSPSPNDPRIEEALARCVEKARACPSSGKHFEESVGDIVCCASNHRDVGEGIYTWAQRFPAGYRKTGLGMQVIRSGHYR